VDRAASDIGDPHNLGIRLWVNGELMQDSNTSKLIFDTAEQIAMLSSRVTLHPGDLVLTGTPAGVGMGAAGSSNRAIPSSCGSKASASWLTQSPRCVA